MTWSTKDKTECVRVTGLRTSYHSFITSPQISSSHSTWHWRDAKYCLRVLVLFPARTSRQEHMVLHSKWKRKKEEMADLHFTIDCQSWLHLDKRSTIDLRLPTSIVVKYLTTSWQKQVNGLFSLVDFAFPSQIMWRTPRENFYFHARSQSFKWIRQGRFKLPEYDFMICVGKTKSISEKGLLAALETNHQGCTEWSAEKPIRSKRRQIIHPEDLCCTVFHSFANALPSSVR